MPRYYYMDEERRAAYLELLAKIDPHKPPRVTAPVTRDKRQKALQKYHRVFFQSQELARDL